MRLVFLLIILSVAFPATVIKMQEDNYTFYPGPVFLKELTYSSFSDVVSGAVSPWFVPPPNYSEISIYLTSTNSGGGRIEYSLFRLSDLTNQDTGISWWVSNVYTNTQAWVTMKVTAWRLVGTSNTVRAYGSAKCVRLF